MTKAAPFSLAVIGHVNHGKTALVRALTGIETDRLPEERARGLSIALGFAWRDHPGACVDFLDAPGHEDFIRAMVMGATGARAALLVVSAVEGFGRQTREHLRIAGLLGLKAGFVAVTKADLLAQADRPSLQRTLAHELEGTFLAGTPVVFCSSTTGAGLDAVHAEIQNLATHVPATEPLPGAYLPLDRVFSVAGVGTVATGTLQGGPLSAGDEAVLLPSGRNVSLRQLQVHGEAVEVAVPGGRVAVGLRGVSADEAKVGEVLCRPGAYEPSLLVDVVVTLAPESARPLRSGAEIRVMWGARQDMAKVRLMGAAQLAPGEHGLAQFRFSAPVAAHAGQRAILRRPSPAETIGGAEVLDPNAPVLRTKSLAARQTLLEAATSGDLDRIGRELATRDGGVIRVSEVTRLARRSATAVRAQLAGEFENLDVDVMATPASVAAARIAYLEQVSEAHRKFPARAWAPLGGIRDGLRSTSRRLVDHAEAQLAAAGEIRLQAGRVARIDHDPLAALSAADLARLRRIDADFLAGGATPPAVGGLADPQPADPELVGLLVESGRLVSLRNHALRQTVVFHIEALDAALERLGAAFPPPAEFTTGEARAILETSRKFIVPMLEFLDARTATIRLGDVRQVTGAQNLFGVPPIPL